MYGLTSVPPSELQFYFERAMAKFLEEQGSATNAPYWDASNRGQVRRDRGPTHIRSSQRAEHPGPPGDMPDVDMESEGSSQGEYDPDDLTFPVTSVRATVASTTTSGPPHCHSTHQSFGLVRIEGILRKGP